MILGVDPGTIVTGYGIVAVRAGVPELIGLGEIRPVTGIPPEAKLRHLFEAITTVIETFRPSGFAIESAFYGKNAQSTLKLGQARGALMLAAAVGDIPVFEYSPREIKKSITGNGGGAKEQVRFMVRELLHLHEGAIPLDTSDAIATALCHINRLGQRARRPATDWKTFAKINPERIVR